MISYLIYYQERLVEVYWLHMKVLNEFKFGPFFFMLDMTIFKEL